MRLTSPAAPSTEGPAAPVLDLRAASLGYAAVPVLQGVDFTLSRGEVVAILGPNGSGKSTLVKGLLRLVRLSSGTLSMYGTAADSFRDWARFGYLPQRAPAAAGFPASVGEVVASGRLSRMRRYRRRTPADGAAIARALDLVGLDGRASEGLATLSGGQQRRVLLARALAGEPDVLLLDEPMAGVDLANQQVLADTLRQLIASGTTVVFVAHELGPLEPLITRVVQMRDGRVAYDGPLAGAPDALAQHDDHCAPVAHTSHLGL